MWSGSGRGEGLWTRLSGREVSHRGPHKAPHQRPPGTFFEVCRLDRHSRGVISCEVGRVHVEAPDNTLDAQLDYAPVVTWGCKQQEPPRAESRRRARIPPPSPSTATAKEKLRKRTSRFREKWCGLFLGRACKGSDDVATRDRHSPHGPSLLI